MALMVLEWDWVWDAGTRWAPRRAVGLWASASVARLEGDLGGEMGGELARKSVDWWAEGSGGSLGEGSLSARVSVGRRPDRQCLCRTDHLRGCLR